MRHIHDSFSALTLLVGRHTSHIRPIKTSVVGYWHDYLSRARCRLHMAQLMPLTLTVSCFSKIQIGFTFVVPAHPHSPGKRALKRVCVCLCHIHTSHSCTHITHDNNLVNKLMNTSQYSHITKSLQTSLGAHRKSNIY